MVVLATKHIPWIYIVEQKVHKSGLVDIWTQGGWRGIWDMRKTSFRVISLSLCIFILTHFHSHFFCFWVLNFSSFIFTFTFPIWGPSFLLKFVKIWWFFFVSLFGCFHGFMWCSDFIIIFEHPNWQSWLERGGSCEVCGKWERCPNMGKWGKPGLYSWVILHDICSVCIIYSWKRQMLNMINKQRCPNMGIWGSQDKTLGYTVENSRW